MTYLISLGLGLQALTLDSVAQSDTLLTLTVRATSENVNPLTQKTITNLQKINGVQYVLPRMVTKGVANLETQQAPVTINAVDGEYFSGSDDARILVGRAFRSDDTQTMVVTTGFLKLFGLDTTRVPLVTFKVAFDPTEYPDVSAIPTVTISGVVEANTVAIYLPRKYTEAQVGLVSNYDSVRLRVLNVSLIETVSKQVVQQGYRVEAVIDTIEQINQVFKWVRIILGSLGMIAVVVASIGMFNTLTISLLERTKEIGIMKALGVKRGDIRRLFLVEAVMMGLIGGLVGLVGALLAQQITYFAFTVLASFLQGKVPQLFVNDPIVYAGFMLLAIVVAMGTGIYPAQRAAKINPIEAIRYE